MNKEKYLSDIHDIKEIMDRSSRFISLSGLSGVSAGIIALFGAYFAYLFIYQESEYFDYKMVGIDETSMFNLFILAGVVLLLSLGSGIFFTSLKAGKNKQKIWDRNSKRLLSNLMIPLATGGVLCLIFLSRGYVGILAPLTLIFYGLALVNASKYTLNEIRSLGILEIVLGLMAMYFIGYGLLFWAIGFGVLHIIYGIIMHMRYGS
ncbi:hypothetical protein [Pararhodonellum marinum]|uniref:hypothetical protein n=1 Tax=Pararhodonellum marinum TaxID=2755358 RepID=UPI00188E3BF2|nr:hypothetical protein [Pararhodonellum marinum]